MKTIVYADYGSWKMCMNTMVAQIDRMFSFIWKHKPGMKSNSTAKCKKPPCRKFTIPPFSNLVLDSCLEFLYFLPFLNLHKNRCLWPATVCKTVLFCTVGFKRCQLKYGRRLYKINRAFFTSLTSLISFLASLQTSSLTVRARNLYQVPE